MNRLDDTGNLKFTSEIEDNMQIAFLDSLVHRNDDGTLYTTVYRKPTHTDQYLHFTSHHPLSQRLGVIRTLMDRADNLCSREADKQAEVAHVKQALVRCGYPAGVITSVVRKTAQSRMLSTTSAKEPKRKTQHNQQGSMVVLPYLKGLSEKCRRIFARYNVQTALKPACTLRRMLVKPKDSRPLMHTSDCVYRIPCANCNEVYIGETGRHLQERLDEHKMSVGKAERPRYTRSRAVRAQEEKYSSAFAEHVATTNHSVAWKDVTLLATHCSNRKARWIRESICIRADKGHYANRNEGAYKMSRTWDKLLLPPVNAGIANTASLASQAL